jgi:hypothetical protein
MLHQENNPPGYQDLHPIVDLGTPSPKLEKDTTAGADTITPHILVEPIMGRPAGSVGDDYDTTAKTSSLFRDKRWIVLDFKVVLCEKKDNRTSAK